MPRQSIRLVARLVRLLTELKSGARTGVRSTATTGSGAAGNSAATVGRGIKAGVKDFASAGGKTWWSHMPKAPQLPGALTHVTHMGDGSGGHEEDDADWDAHGLGGDEDIADFDSAILGMDLTAMRTDTPADVLLAILSDMMDGRQPNLQDVALARTALLRHMDLYQPLNGGGGIRGADLDAEVADSLMRQVGAAGSGPALASRQGSSVQEAGGPAGDARGAADGAVFDEIGEVEVGFEDLREALAMLLALEQQAQQQQGGMGEEPEAGVELGGGGRMVEAHLVEGPAVPSPVLDEVERCLSLVDGWQYDTWRLAEASQGHALSTLCFFLLQREGLTAQFRLPPRRLARLLRTLEAGYAANPYHNATHAADVLQTLHVLLRGSGLSTHYLDRLGLLAAYLAATVHDHGHPGLTSDFLVATQDRLALRYNDRAPLENHHGASFFQLLRRPDMDVLGALGGAERAAFRRQVLDLVLATDMKQHFALLAHFNTAHRLAAYSKEAGPWAGIKREGTEGGAGGGAEGQEGSAHHQQLQDPRPSDETERTLSLQIALKVADLGHLGEEVSVHKRWVRCLEEEFFRQGDQERALGLPISPLFDRAKQGVSKSQVGFYDFIALPLVHAFASAFPGARPLLGCFVANYEHWRAAERADRERERAEAEAAGAGPSGAEGAPTTAT